MTSLTYLSKVILALSVRAKGCHFNRTLIRRSAAEAVAPFVVVVVATFLPYLEF